MSLDQIANFIKATVSGGYSSTSTVIELTTGQGAKLPNPTNGQYNLVWYNATDYSDPADDPNVEIVRATALTSDALTVLRAQEGTSATQKQNLNKIYKLMLGLTAKMITDIISLAVPGTILSETPTGLVDGSNTTYTTSQNIGTILYFEINGQYIGPSNYTFTGKTITFNTAIPSSLAGTEFNVVYTTNQISFYSGGSNQTLTGNATLSPNYFLNLVNAAGGARTVALPAAASSNNVTLSIKKIDTSANAVTIKANAAELIDGVNTKVLSTAYAALQLYCNGTAWYTI